jgi:hypothetical protein
MKAILEPSARAVSGAGHLLDGLRAGAVNHLGDRQYRPGDAQAL